MRHELHTEINIDATPEVVWDVLTDLDRYAEWNPFIVESSGRVEVGERLTNRLRMANGKVMTFRPEVTEAETGVVFEWLGRLFVPGLFDGRHRFELAPTPSGGTTVMHSERFRGLLVRVMRSSLERDTRTNFEAMNEALRDRAQAVLRSAS